MSVHQFTPRSHVTVRQPAQTANTAALPVVLVPMTTLELSLVVSVMRAHDAESCRWLGHDLPRRVHPSGGAS